MSVASKKKHLDRGKNHVNWPKEEILTLEEVAHRQNDRLYAPNASDCLKIAGVVYAVGSQFHSWLDPQLHLMRSSLL